MTNIDQNTDTVLPEETQENEYLNMVLVPKPFTFEGLISTTGLTKVYMPGQVDDTKKYTCVCVHMCDQFANYPVIEWGIRYIPSGTQCKFGGTCHGSRIFVNGTPTNQNFMLSYSLVKGLLKPTKTR